MRIWVDPGLRRFGVAFFSFLMLMVILPHGVSAATAEGETTLMRVVRVVDGDTIWVEGGEKIRYVGVDTPEREQAFYREARSKNLELVGGSVVEVVVCRDEPRDRYGRLLAWIYVDGLDVGGELLKAGLARVLMIPPCGLLKAREYKALEKEAKRRELGVWGVNKKPVK